jgi:large subunit ribosomal protein L6
MSKIGNKEIQLPADVTLQVNTADTNERSVLVKGPKGELTFALKDGINVNITDQTVNVSAENIKMKAMHGTTRAVINNMVEGVSKGFQKVLVLVGVGYRANVLNQSVILELGHSHKIDMPLPEGISAETQKGKLIISGIDKQKVGAYAMAIRDHRKPEPYKGKGVLYDGEKIVKKSGKKQ